MPIETKQKPNETKQKEPQPDREWVRCPLCNRMVVAPLFQHEAICRAEGGA